MERFDDVPIPICPAFEIKSPVPALVEATKLANVPVEDALVFAIYRRLLVPETPESMRLFGAAETDIATNPGVPYTIFDHD